MVHREGIEFMCGRYMVVTEGEIIEMQAIFEDLGKDLSTSGGTLPENDAEVFPGSITQVITAVEEQLLLTPMFWGFKKWDDKGLIINARSETVLDKPFFRESVIYRRCIIPSKGFLEWTHDSTGTRRQRTSDKYLIRREGSPFLFMAGIFRQNEGISEFSILTLPASEQMRHIHDRMPLHLNNDRSAEWLLLPEATDLLNCSEASAAPLVISRV